ncbi:MAG: hypothetical protein HY594_04415 [Candidatus Omnitrophica bacterium]|nr:hypothetical protein [Candidatus Omnitrophota bacterium]
MIIDANAGTEMTSQNLDRELRTTFGDHPPLTLLTTADALPAIPPAAFSAWRDIWQELPGVLEVSCETYSVDGSEYSLVTWV